jgi:hypothetical protein
MPVLPICRAQHPDHDEIKCAMVAGHEGPHGAAAFAKFGDFVRWDD